MFFAHLNFVLLVHPRLATGPAWPAGVGPMVPWQMVGDTLFLQCLIRRLQDPRVSRI